MDLYGTDLRLSDIGELEGEDRADYQLDVLDLRCAVGSEAACQNAESSNDCGRSTRTLMEEFHFSANLDNNWLDTFLEDNVFHDDTLVSDSFQGPEHVNGEHSYSLTNENEDVPLCDMTYEIKLETETDMDTELFRAIHPDLAMLPDATIGTDVGEFLVDTTSLLSRSESPPTTTTNIHHLHQHPVHHQLQQLTRQAHCRSVPVLSSSVVVSNDRLIQRAATGTLLLTSVKEEPTEGEGDEEECDVTYTTVLDTDINDHVICLPPTPPSSSCSGESDVDGLTPTRSNPPSPTGSFTRHVAIRHNQSMWTATLQQPFFSNNPGSSSGTLFLTEEEKRTLITEGYPLPTKLPLSKQEEKNLKKIRRKIKNKISAQESRRKKKEYLEILEKKVETVSQENCHLKKKVDLLETNNKSLMSQLQRLQGMVKKLGVPAPTGTCVMILIP